ncbi:hypothetical protein [uncultured Celeribacter sp.]|uniref:hypothetical protein n=1 Tax=uncultured Celeribacter sp. TaxID=1303376 RepID=UPI002AA7B82B|nr:hypothetical protein [uncultured Celeribacter sp.]
MPTEELIVMGASIVNNPIGTSYDYRGDANDGAYMTGGESVFGDDDIVVFTIDNVNMDGSLDSQSQVVSIVVYDNAADYANGESLYEYSNTGSGGGWPWSWGDDTGDVSTSVHDMGDNYLYFQAGGFTSTDPNAPISMTCSSHPARICRMNSRSGSATRLTTIIMATASSTLRKKATASSKSTRTTALPKTRSAPRSAWHEAR